MSIPTANSFVSQNKLLGGVLGPVLFSGPRSDQALFIKPDRLSSLKGEFGDYLSDTQYMYIISLTYNSGMPVYDLDDYDSVIEIINLIRTKIIDKIGGRLCCKSRQFSFYVYLIATDQPDLRFECRAE